MTGKRTWLVGLTLALAGCGALPDVELKPQATLPLDSYVSLQVTNPGLTNRFLRHAGSLAFTEVVDANSSDLLKQDASWRVVRGLADAGCYSLESRNFSGSYLRHAGSRLRLDPNANIDLFRQDATFCGRPALDGSGNVSLESKNLPGRFIRHRASEVWLDTNDNSAIFRQDATWASAPAWSSPATNPGGYKRVGYFVQWGIYGRNFKVFNLDRSGAAATLTHINYAFGGITPEGTCTVTVPGISDSFADYTKAFAAAESVDGVGDTWDAKLRGNFGQLKKLKAKYPSLKVLISLGGWTWSDRFSDVALTDAARKRFVSSCIDLYVRGNLPVTDGAGGPGAGAGVFDGIDIDWEYPASEGEPGNVVRIEDTRNFTLLLEEFRRQLDAVGGGKLLTAALPSAPAKVAKLEVAGVARVLDLMNVMTYDFRGGWTPNGPTNFHSNLFPDPAGPGSAEEKAWSVDTAVNAHLQRGAPAGKLIVGIPYYGRGWTGVGGANGGLYQAASGLPQGAFEPGIDDYKVLVNRPGTVYRNAVTKQMWKYDGSTFWSYDDAGVIAEKTAYIKQKGLGGSMVWSLEGDDANATLSKAIFSGLR